MDIQHNSEPILLDYGANVNLKSRYQENALMKAARSDNIKIENYCYNTKITLQKDYSIAIKTTL